MTARDVGGLQVAALTGEAAAAVTPALATLRIEVFRAYPYLYDGDADYERAYLAAYARAPGAVIVGAWDGDRLVGAATGAPMAEQDPAWAAPFAERGEDLSRLLYCGESVLSAPYRGRGVGHAFFDVREAHARALGATASCFCAVVRPEDHPARPHDHRSLEPFWRARGYAPLPGVEAQFSWREVGDAAETPHRLQFWRRDL